MCAWPDHLKQSRSARENFSPEALCLFQSILPSVIQALENYNNKLQIIIQDSEEEYGTADHDCIVSKKEIIETRGALRFMLFWTAPFRSERGEVESKVRCAAQSEAARKLQCVVTSILASPSSSADSKCRLLCARLLCNMVTSNSDSASVIAFQLVLSPPPDLIRQEMRLQLLFDGGESRTRMNGRVVTWLDMILVSARVDSRETLAAIVAALYNCICALSTTSGNLLMDANELAKKVARDALFMSSLIRQMLSTKKVLGVSTDGEDCSDCATEWISRLLIKLCCLGQLQTIYRSAGGGLVVADEEAADEQEVSHTVTVAPEQLVFVHCILSSVEESLHSLDSTSTKQSHPLEGVCGSSKVLRSSLVFLATEATQIRRYHKGALTKDPKVRDSDELKCQDAAYICILEVLATSLGYQDETIIDTRAAISQETTLMTDILTDIAAVVDVWTEKSATMSARELKLSTDEQLKVTLYVRLIGNLCFQCRENQNVLRMSLPPRDHGLSAGTAAEAPEISNGAQRTALHVLLSSTSFSYGCFTLREWSIIAIRNALHNNVENQELVAKLEAQRPVQSAELTNLGIQVKMDERGKVSVLPKEGDTTEK